MQLPILLMIQNEPLIRLSCFGGVLVVMTIWEAIAPCRPLKVSKMRRWGNNISIAVLNTITVRLVIPLTALGSASMADNYHWGILNNMTLPLWQTIVLAVVALDFIIYLQHVLFHALPLLWRFHRIHHADLDFDVTTGLRFHPVEIWLSMGIKVLAVIFLGAPPVAVLIFEILLNATAMFNHSNIAMPRMVDRMLRVFVVTPDMHRIHHSVIPQETNSNFGFNLPWWDYALGTYRRVPQGGNEKMSIGLVEFQESQVEWLPWLLILPFTNLI